LDDHKHGRNVGDTPVYTAEMKELGVGVASKYPWLANLEEKKAIEEAKEQQIAAQRGDTGRVASNEELPACKRRYSGDIALLPDHPMALKDYTARPDGRYKCLHQDSECGFGTCGKANHQCCKDGLTLANFEKALSNKKVTYEKQVERLVNRGELDMRHITWTPRLKDQDAEAIGEKKKSPKKTKPVAQVSPATAPPSDTPTAAALTPVQPPVARV
jgi:hypothetical protein